MEFNKNELELLKKILDDDGCYHNCTDDCSTCLKEQIRRKILNGLKSSNKQMVQQDKQERVKMAFEQAKSYYKDLLTENSWKFEDWEDLAIDLDWNKFFKTEEDKLEGCALLKKYCSVRNNCKDCPFQNTLCEVVRVYTDDEDFPEDITAKKIKQAIGHFFYEYL